jgi:hypothetical protein
MKCGRAFDEATAHGVALPARMQSRMGTGTPAA